MLKRKRVPKALHSELTEYSSLLRALRTSHTLDVATHLARASLGSTNSNDTDQESDNETFPRHVSRTPSLPQLAPSSPTDSADNAIAGPSHLSLSKVGSQKRKLKRDLWTRWPHPVDDIPTPEWEFQDEIEHLITQTLTLRPPQHPPQLNDNSTERVSPSQDSSEAGLDIDPDPPPYARHITKVVLEYLTTILALLAAHTPARPPSMQNRIEPMDWRSVVDVISSCSNPDIANTKILQNVITRMEDIYGPPTDPTDQGRPLRAIQRVQATEKARQKLRDMFKEPNASIFQISVPPSLPSLPSGCRKSSRLRKAKSTATIPFKVKKGKKAVQKSLIYSRFTIMPR